MGKTFRRDRDAEDYDVKKKFSRNNRKKRNRKYEMNEENSYELQSFEEFYNKRKR